MIHLDQENKGKQTNPLVHYYYTTKEQEVMSGKGPGTFDHPAAACGNGSFHFQGTRKIPQITCPVCKQRLRI